MRLCGDDVLFIIKDEIKWKEFNSISYLNNICKVFWVKWNL